MSFVETDIYGQIMIVKLNRPERLNALSKVIREGMADAFNQFKNDIEEFDKKYRGKMATIQYADLSTKGIPFRSYIIPLGA